jgi:hypothetical protein
MTPAGDAPQPADGEGQNRTGDTTISVVIRPEKAGHDRGHPDKKYLQIARH